MAKQKVRPKAPFYFQVKLKKSGGGQIEGVASTPALDRALDIIEPQAFAKALEVYMKNPVLLFNHDYDRVAGHVDEAQVTDDGLYVKSTVNDREIWDLVKQADLRAYSVGYIPTRWRFEVQDGKEIRVIEELDLLEISIVSVPANQETLFSMSKSISSALNQLETKGVRGAVTGVEVIFDKEAKRYTVRRAGVKEKKAPPKKKEEKQVASAEGEDTTEEKPAPEAPAGADEQGHAGNDTPEGGDTEDAVSEGDNGDQPSGEEESTSPADTDGSETPPESEVKALEALAEAKGYRLVKADSEPESNGTPRDAVAGTDFKKFQDTTEQAVNALTKQVSEMKQVVDTLNSQPVRKAAQARRVDKFKPEGDEQPNRQQKSTKQLLHILTNPVKS